MTYFGIKGNELWCPPKSFLLELLWASKLIPTFHLITYSFHSHTFSTTINTFTNRWRTSPFQTEHYG